jgi:hypothetical protein
MGGIFTSQAKFYIDFSGGNFQLKRVDTLARRAGSLVLIW